jgi:DNA-binding transcriptional MerR regulator
MDNPHSQITFEFSDPGANQEPREFLSGNPIAPKEEKKPKSARGRKSIKEAESEWSKVDIPDDETLFQKQYYSIGEVANMFGVNNSLIRFWENEFDILDPRKNRKGDRFFKPSDVKNLQLIYDLLRRRKFTIEGAKDYLKKNKQAEERYAMIQSLQRMRSFLLELKAHL